MAASCRWFNRRSVMRITAVSTTLAALVLAGCSSTSTDTPNYADQSAAYNAMLDDIQAMPVSTAATMPTTGSATYDGYALVVADTPGQTAVVGEADISANFTNGTLSGNLTDFVGVVNGAAEETLDGSIALSNGVIGATTAASLTANMTGTLIGDTSLNTVTVIGGIQGEFHDDGGLNAKGLAALETPGTSIIVNGVGRDGDVGIVALR
jgi:hypothetical protein